jgi:hypothetical protein
MVCSIGQLNLSSSGKSPSSTNVSPEKFDNPSIQTNSNRNHDNHNNNDNKKLIQNNDTIAYVISLVKCGDKQTTSAGLIDAALILQHSIHQISRRNYAISGSRYDYTMIALVHRQAEECSHVLRTVGFQIQIVDTPIDQTQIQNEHLRKSIHREWCCGHGKLNIKVLFLKKYLRFSMEGINVVIINCTNLN